MIEVLHTQIGPPQTLVLFFYYLAFICIWALLKFAFKYLVQHFIVVIVLEELAYPLALVGGSLPNIALYEFAK